MISRTQIKVSDNVDGCCNQYKITTLSMKSFKCDKRYHFKWIY